MNGHPPVPTNIPDTTLIVPNPNAAEIPLVNPAMPQVPQQAPGGTSPPVPDKIPTIISDSADPKATKQIYDGAMAFYEVTKVPFSTALYYSKVATESKDTKVKTLLEAIVGRWNLGRLTTRISQVGFKAMQAWRAGDTVAYAALKKEWSELKAQLPALEAVLPAYPDEIRNKEIPETYASFREWATQGFKYSTAESITLGRGIPGVAEQAAQYFERIGGPEVMESMDEGYKKGILPFLGAAARKSLSTVITGIGEVEGGSAFVELVDRGVDPDIALPYARGIGVINGLLEFAEIATLVSMFPGADVVFQKAFNGLVKKAVIGPLVNNLLVKTAAKAALGWTTEMLQEEAQEAVTFFGENFAIELNNAVKGTSLEKNTDFLARAKALFHEFGPTMAVMAGIPAGYSYTKEAVAKAKTATAAPVVAAPAPATVRKQVDTALAEETPNVEAAKTVVVEAEAAKTTEVENAEAITPQMVNEIEELGDLNEEIDRIFSTKEEIAPEITPEEVVAPENIQPEGAVLEAPAAPEVYSTDQMQADVEQGKWVEDAALYANAEQPWASDELSQRENLRDLATYLADTGTVSSFDSFLTAAKEVDTENRSDSYYRNIWESSPKAEIPIDAETQTIDIENHMENVIAAEERAVKLSKAEKLLGELDKSGTAWSPQTETVREILAAKPQVPSAVMEEGGLDIATAQNKVLSNKKKLVKTLIKDIVKPPSAATGYEAGNQLMVLQAPYTTKETKYLEKGKQAIRNWQIKHPGASISKDAQDFLNRRSIYDLTAQELIELHKEQKNIRAKGIEQTKELQNRKMERRQAMFSALAKDIPGLEMAERLHKIRSVETEKQAAKLARKGWLKINLNDPVRIFTDMGPGFKEYFWDKKIATDGVEEFQRRKRSRIWGEILKRTGVLPLDIMRNMPGNKNRWIDDMMTYYGQMKDPDGRKAVLYGNDEDETEINQLIRQLPQKYKDAVDAIQDANEELYKDLRRVQIEDKGTVAPPVRHYLGIRREGDWGKEMSAQLAADAEVRTRARLAGPSEGMIIERVKYKEGVEQPRIRTDFLNLLVDNVNRDSAYIAKAELAGDWRWLLGGKNKESKAFRAGFEQKYGTPAMKFLDDYTRAVMNPGSFVADDINSLVSRATKGLSNTALMWKVGSVFVQAEGPFRSLASLDYKQYRYALVGIWKAMTQAAKTAEQIYVKSPAMLGMAEEDMIDPALREGMRYRHTKTEFGKLMQRVLRWNQKWGFAGLKETQRRTIIAEWTAIYSANVGKVGEAKAIEMANDSVYKHQPSGRLENAPRMYWIAQRNWLLRYMVRFTRTSQKLAQMFFHDIPQNIAKGEIGKMTGVLTVFAIGATLSFIRRHKKLPKTPEEWKKAGVEAGLEAADATFFNIPSALAKGWTSEGYVTEIKPMEAFVRTANIAHDLTVGEISTKQLWQTVSIIGQYLNVPTPAMENMFRTVYDVEEGKFTITPYELLGRKPRE